MLLRTVILDDEEPALDLLEIFCTQTHKIDIVGRFNDASKALIYLQQHPVDLLISDINMPWLNGVELKKILPDALHTIFITAHSELAIQGFDVGAVDYLLKPVLFPRFLKAINKVVKLHEKDTQDIDKKNSAFIFIKDGSVKRRIEFDDILYVQAQGDYLSIHLTNNSFMVLHTLSEFFNLLPNNYFVRVHRSTIVNLAKVDVVNKDHLIIAGQDITIGKTYRSNVYDLVSQYGR
jgi:two-component system LytT family response regulator